MTLEALSVALLGEDPATSEATPSVEVSGPTGHVVVDARDVTIVDDRGTRRIHGASFEVRAGEILGIAAVEGSGQAELLRALAGRMTTSGGVLETPASRGFVPEDRHRDALVLDFSLTENVALRHAGAQRGRIDWTNLRAKTAALLRRFDVRGGQATSRAGNLSGGNQQKLVLARELDGSPALLVAENPTRGLDIRAARDVHERLSAEAASGAAVVVFSSDLDEVMALASRVLAIHAGVVRDCAHDREAVGRAMLGVA
jgi:simple sugar transport system ATP-binding protein